jgi:hypothetical protein
MIQWFSEARRLGLDCEFQDSPGRRSVVSAE